MVSEEKFTKLVSVNIENFNTNLVFLETLLNDFQIVAIQEHWLYGFEKGKLIDFCEKHGFSIMIKSSDDNDPLTPLQRPRGKGGVALLWSKRHDQHVTALYEEGGNRICAIHVETLEGLVTIINCYLPCRGNKEADREFMNVADEVSEIVVKYKLSSDVILLGDMNASMFRDPPLPRDKYLKDVLIEMNLSLPENYPEDHTYRHGLGKSTIDYIIHNKQGLVTSVTVFDEHCNTSPHSAVSANIPYVQSVAMKSEEKSAVMNKLKWDKLDKVKNKELVENRLSDSHVLGAENDNIDLVVEDLTDILVSTA